MSNDGPTEIIAEVAQGYEGDAKLTELLTTAAIASTSDAVKYQLVYADELVTPDYKHYALFQSLEMDIEIWKEVRYRLTNNNKRLYFDVYGPKSLSDAQEIGADGVKVSTTDFYNRELIEQAVSIFERVIISIGGIPISDVDQIVNFIEEGGSRYRNICFLYGFQAEPTPLIDSNLNKLSGYVRRYPNYQIGFMDHSDGGMEEGLLLSLVALGYGVTVIEKHLTLDRLLKIEDYTSALTPERFQEFVRLIRKFELALGETALELTAIEREYRAEASKVVVSARALKKGCNIEREDIVLKRSGKRHQGNTFYLLEDVIGQTLKTSLPKDNPIFKEAL